MVTVRPARPEDAAAIRRVAREAWHATYDDILSPDAVDERIEAWYSTDTLGESVNAPGSFSVAVDDELVGFAQLAPTGPNPPAPFTDEDVAVLYRLYVHPDRWREGIGSQLLSAAEDRIDDDLDRIRLAVYADNEIGRSFFEAEGFEAVEELDTSPQERILEKRLG